VLSPYPFIAHRIVQMVLRPQVIDFIDSAFGSERLGIQIEEHEVGERSAVVGQTLAGSEIGKPTNCIIVALKRRNADVSFNPRPEETRQVGDHSIAGSKAHY
jgi:voltage-gated potassium channel